jgi:hypothetical protein
MAQETAEVITLRYGFGHLLVNSEGIAVDTLSTTGFIPWANLASCAKKRLMLTNWLAFTMHNIDDFIASKATMAERNTKFSFVQNMVDRVERLGPALDKSRKQKNAIISLFGLEPFPEDGSEKSLYEWALKNKGYHFGFPTAIVPNANMIVALINNRQSSL